MCRWRTIPLRSIRIVVGQAQTLQRFQIVCSLSCTTGYRTPSFFVASTTLWYGFSQTNSGLCTPMTRNPSFSYRSYQPRNCGITFLQLIQPKVQNSTSTTRPRRPGVVKGPLLIQRSPATSGAGAPRREAWPVDDVKANPRPPGGRRRRTTRARTRLLLLLHRLVALHHLIVLHHGLSVLLHVVRLHVAFHPVCFHRVARLRLVAGLHRFVLPHRVVLFHVVLRHRFADTPRV